MFERSKQLDADRPPRTREQDKKQFSTDFRLPYSRVSNAPRKSTKTKTKTTNSIRLTIRKVSRHIPSNKKWIGNRPFRSFQSECIRIGPSMSICPENVGSWSSSPQNESECSPRPIQSSFSLLQGLSCRKSPSALFRSNWVKYDCNPRLDRKNCELQEIIVSTCSIELGQLRLGQLLCSRIGGSKREIPDRRPNLANFYVVEK